MTVGAVSGARQRAAGAVSDKGQWGARGNTSPSRDSLSESKSPEAIRAHVLALVRSYSPDVSRDDPDISRDDLVGPSNANRNHVGEVADSKQKAGNSNTSRITELEALVGDREQRVAELHAAQKAGAVLYGIGTADDDDEEKLDGEPEAVNHRTKQLGAASQELESEAETLGAGRGTPSQLGDDIMQQDDMKDASESAQGNPKPPKQEPKVSDESCDNTDGQAPGGARRAASTIWASTGWPSTIDGRQAEGGGSSEVLRSPSMHVILEELERERCICWSDAVCFSAGIDRCCCTYYWHACCRHTSLLHLLMTYLLLAYIPQQPSCSPSPAGFS